MEFSSWEEPLKKKSHRGEKETEIQKEVNLNATQVIKSSKHIY